MHQHFLREAIRLSIDEMQDGRGGPFGAVVLSDGRIVGAGSNRVTTTNDPTAHAEIVAIRAACTRLGTFSLAGGEIYASCEPCPMCLAAIYWARLGRLYYAATRADAIPSVGQGFAPPNGRTGFDDAQIYDEISLAPDARSIPTTQALRRVALATFDAWAKQASRVEY